MELKNKNHKFLKEFCPEITVLDAESRDFLTDFNAGAGKELPIAAWCLLAIVNYANKLLDTVLGFKALFLHSVPEAETFYIKNGFQDMRINMHPFVCIDSDMRSMWMPLRNIHINYEK